MPTVVVERRVDRGRIHVQVVSDGSGLSHTRPIIAVLA